MGSIACDMCGLWQSYGSRCIDCEKKPSVSKSILNKSKSAPFCIFYNTARGCQNGKNCKFVHSIMVCRNAENCPEKDNCKFSSSHTLNTR